MQLPVWLAGWVGMEWNGLGLDSLPAHGSPIRPFVHVFQGSLPPFWGSDGKGAGHCTHMPEHWLNIRYEKIKFPPGDTNHYFNQ